MGSRLQQEYARWKMLKVKKGMHGQFSVQSRLQSSGVSTTTSPSTKEQEPMQLTLSSIECTSNPFDRPHMSTTSAPMNSSVVFELEGSDDEEMAQGDDGVSKERGGDYQLTTLSNLTWAPSPLEQPEIPSSSTPKNSSMVFEFQVSDEEEMTIGEKDEDGESSCKDDDNDDDYREEEEEEEDDEEDEEEEGEEGEGEEEEEVEVAVEEEEDDEEDEGDDEKRREKTSNIDDEVELDDDEDTGDAEGLLETQLKRKRKKCTSQSVLIRNDMPPKPSEYTSKFDFDDGEGPVDVTLTTEPPEESIQTAPRVCKFGDLPTLSALGKKLQGEKSVEKFLKAIITPDIIDKVVQYTNTYALNHFKSRLNQYNTADQNGKRTRLPQKWKKLDATELWAYIGATYYMGLTGLNKQSVDQVFCRDGKVAHLPLLQSFPKQRYKAITRYLTFHDHSEETKSKENRRHKIQEFTNPVITNCSRLIIPSNTVVVDESLVSFKGRVMFRQYLPSKPDRYGIKFFVACDATTGAVVDAICYVGKEASERAVGLSTRVVLDLVQSMANSNRCIVTDRYYTSVELAYELSRMNLDCVGTTMPNRKGIPKEFAQLNLHKYYAEKSKMEKTKKRVLADDDEVRDTLTDVVRGSMEKTGRVGFLFSDNLTLVKYEPIPTKSVHLISTMHHKPEVGTKNGKPNVVLFYNKKKFGVDLLDQLVGYYSTKRTSRRWVMRVFYWTLDVAAIQAYIVFQLANPEFAKNIHYRRTFMVDLADALMRKHQSRRSKAGPQVNINRLGLVLRLLGKRSYHERETAMSELLGTFEKEFGRKIQGKRKFEPKQKRRKRGFCYVQSCRLINRHDAGICKKCKNPVCGQHSSKVETANGREVTCNVNAFAGVFCNSATIADKSIQCNLR